MFFFHQICDLATLAIIQKQNLAKFDHRWERKVEFLKESHYILFWLQLNI
jgi:hypothetical protein